MTIDYYSLETLFTRHLVVGLFYARLPQATGSVLD